MRANVFPFVYNGALEYEHWTLNFQSDWTLNPKHGGGGRLDLDETLITLRPPSRNSVSFRSIVSAQER